MARVKTDPRAKLADERAPTPPAQQQSWPTAEKDIARRAYDRYLARGGEPGHALDDWLDAERELQQAVGSVTE